MSNQGSQFKQRLTQVTHSIRFRLVLWFVLILAIVMAAFSGFIYWRQAQDARSVAVARLNITVEHLEGAQGESEHGLEPLVPGLSANLSQNLTANSDVLASEVVVLQDTNGNMVGGNGVLTNEQIQQLNLPAMGWSGVQEVRVPKIPQVENTRYLFINPAIQQNGRTAGYLLVGVPLDANNQLGKLVISLILGNLITLVIALVGGFWLANRAMRPVRTIAQTARQISETDLHMRLHLPGRDELSELGNTFDAMLDRLQAAFERQRQFTADASHELRTPLTIIDLEASRGLTARRSVQEYEKILHTIKAENHFMIRLATNLLALARMEAGQLSMKPEPLDVSELASEVIERLAAVAAAQGVTLDVGELPKVMVHGDRPTLLQMLTKLVENAIKYSADVEAPQVTISAGERMEEAHPVAWIRISDNGVGIAPEDQGHIFDRFYQVDKARAKMEMTGEELSEPETTGTGLGLAIAQWIAKSHGGEIRVESTLGKGSVFEVCLPTGTLNG
jgi:signal transduction histidine kinase